jgi:hypothetical protein
MTVLGKVLKMLLIHVPGECERVLETPSPNSCGETNIPGGRTLGSRTPHEIDIRVGV